VRITPTGLLAATFKTGGRLVYDRLGAPALSVRGVPPGLVKRVEKRWGDLLGLWALAPPDRLIR